MTPSEQRELKSVFFFFFLNLFCCLDFSKKAFFFLKNRVEKCMYREVSIILAVDLFINCVRKMDICRHHDFTHCSVSIFAITLFFFQPLTSGVATENHLPPCFSHYIHKPHLWSSYFPLPGVCHTVLIYVLQHSHALHIHILKSRRDKQEADLRNQRYCMHIW